MKNIVLVGFMGTGKTTVGKLLAKKTGMPLVDMDHLIEERAGKTISEIFANDGEPHFRTLERTMARELAEKDGLIISTGGGIVLNPDNITDFEKNGLVVCLIASAETVLERLRHDTTRPLLAGDKESQITALLKTRNPLYEAVLHKIYTNGSPSPEATAKEIIDLYESNNP